MGWLTKHNPPSTWREKPQSDCGQMLGSLCNVDKWQQSDLIVTSPRPLGTWVSAQHRPEMQGLLLGSPQLTEDMCFYLGTCVTLCLRFIRGRVVCPGLVCTGLKHVGAGSVTLMGLT